MKIFLNIAFVLLLLIQTFKDGVSYLSFIWNQDYIATTLCENRFEPALMCSGQCYFVATIQAEKEKEAELPVNERQQITNVYIFQSTSSFLPIDTGQGNHHAFSAPSFISDPHLFQVFHPPRRLG